MTRVEYERAVAAYAIPSAHPKSGEPIRLFLYEDQLDVGWALGHHVHLTFSDEPHPRMRNLEKAVDGAIEFIDRIAEEKVVLYRKYLDGRLFSSGQINVEALEATLHGEENPGDPLSFLMPRLEPGCRIEMISWTGKYDRVIDMPA